MILGPDGKPARSLEQPRLETPDWLKQKVYRVMGDRAVELRLQALRESVEADDYAVGKTIEVKRPDRFR